MGTQAGFEPGDEPAFASPRLIALRTRHLVVVLLVAGLALAGLTLVASQRGPDAIDLTATLWLQRIGVPGFATLMAAVSWFGFEPQGMTLPLVVASLCALRGLWIEGVWVLGTSVSGLVTVGLKDVVHRARPPAELVNVAAPLSDPSFPSGHVVQYTTLFGFAFFLVYVLEWRSRLRSLTLVLLALPVVLVGPSRLYLGQHWLSDVLGGYAVATLLLVPTCWAYARWRLGAARARRRRRHARQPSDHRRPRLKPRRTTADE